MSFRGSSKFRNTAGSMPVANDTPAASFRRDFSSDESRPKSELLVSLHKTAEQVDEVLGVVARPIKPYLPGIGRFLIVATFVEDALRIITQWSGQVNYLWSHRYMPYIFAVLFLAINVICMFVGSFCVIFKRRLEYGAGLLIFVVTSQAIAYGLVFDFSFFFRNLSLIGGLLLVLSDAFVQDRRFLSLPGLPLIEDKDRAKYFQLAGRVLIILLFLGFLITKKWTLVGSAFNLIELAACILVAVGFKTRLSASFLVVLLVIQNLVTNPYWKYSTAHPLRDLLRYAFFQTLSIVGGLILIVNTGAGRLSIDEKKKIY